MRISIRIDWENDVERWWQAAGQALKDEPSIGALGRGAVRELIMGPAEKIRLSASEAAIFEQWCDSLEGWQDGPPHAPHPLIFTEI